MAYQADATFVPVMPSFRGFGAAMSKGIVPAAKKSGVDAGSEFAKAFGGKAAAGGSGVEALQKRIAASVTSASKAVAAARSAEEDATRKAKIEELKLQELRDSGKAKASQIAAAEDRLIKSQKALRTAQDRTRSSTQDLADAQSKGNAELRQADQAAARTGRSFRTLGDRIKASLSGANRGAFGGLAASAGRAGSESGRSLRNAFSRTLNAGGGLGRLVKGSLGAAALAAGGAVVAFGSLAVAGATVGIKTAAGMEQARIAFSTMLGSAEKADAFLKQLADFAAKTPFEFPELQTAASSLISAGIEADKVIPIMRTLGDVTSGMGTGSEGVQRATVALQQMSAAGRITGEDLNQLRDAGIPVYDLLAKATGKSKKAVVELAGAGKLGKKELGQMLAALESGKGLERFAGLMEKQSASLSGTFSTLKDTLGQGLARSIEPAVPAIKSGLNQISAAAGSAFSWVAENRDSISNLLKVAQDSLGAFARVAKAAFVPFIGGVTDGRATFKDFADYVATHQEDITRGIVNGATAAIDFGIGLARGAAMGLRAFAMLADGQATFFEFSTRNYGQMLHAAVLAFGWIPGVGDKLKGAESRFSTFSSTVSDSMRGAANGARGLADGIEGNIIPAAERAKDGLTKIGKTEIASAAFRDSAAKAALAIQNIGTRANGSQIRLKSWRDVGDLAAKTQRDLRDRIDKARGALRDQIDAARDAGAGQKALTATWKEGRKRLYDEFIQMGLSKKEAQRLADKYAGIKPKVETKITQPGMKKSREDARDLKNRIDDIPNKKTVIGNVNFKTNAAGVVVDLNKQFQLVKGGPKLTLADGGPIRGVGGPRQDNILGVDKRTKQQTAWVSANEFVVNAEAYKRNKKLVEAINSGRRFHLPSFAGGGAVPNFGSILRSHQNAMGRGADGGGYMLGYAVKTQLNKLLKATRDLQTTSGNFGKIDVARPREHTTFRGHTFTNLFAATLRAAEVQAHRAFSIYQGGFRPATSYSGTSHRGDAIDARVDMPLLRASRSKGVAMWDRTGKGNWVAHMHGVPRPGAGYAGGSGIWQAQDYARGGDGLKGGGLVRARQFDTGGPLPPGLTLALNGTGKSETVLLDSQLQGLIKAGERGRRGGPTLHFDGVYNEMTAEKLADQVAARLSQVEALHPAW